MKKIILVAVGTALIIFIVGVFVAHYVLRAPKLSLEFEVKPYDILRLSVDKEYEIALTLKNLDRKAFTKTLDLTIALNGVNVVTLPLDFSTNPLLKNQERKLYSNLQGIEPDVRTLTWEARGSFRHYWRTLAVKVEKKLEVKKFLSFDDVELVTRDYPSTSITKPFILDEFLINIKVRNVGPRTVTGPITVASYIDGARLGYTRYLIAGDAKTELKPNDVLESRSGSPHSFKTPGEHTLLMVLNPDEELLNMLEINLEAWLKEKRLLGEDFVIKEIDVADREVVKGLCKANAYIGDKCSGYRCIAPNTRPLAKCYATYDECFNDQEDFDGDCVPASPESRCKGYLYHPGMGRACYSFDQCQRACVFPQ